MQGSLSLNDHARLQRATMPSAMLKYPLLYNTCQVAHATTMQHDLLYSKVCLHRSPQYNTAMPHALAACQLQNLKHPMQRYYRFSVAAASAAASPATSAAASAAGSAAVTTASLPTATAAVVAAASCRLAP
jgi:hypothetical protein